MGGFNLEGFGEWTQSTAHPVDQSIECPIQGIAHDTFDASHRGSSAGERCERARSKNKVLQLFVDRQEEGRGRGRAPMSYASCKKLRF